MKPLNARSLVFFVAVSVTQAWAALAQEAIVKRDDIVCILEHFDVYEKIVTDPILILFKECPNPRITISDFIGESSNKLPNFISKNDYRIEEASSVISLTKEQLSCLYKKYKDEPIFFKNSVIKIPEHGCLK
jgi:hypothetical protein